MNPTRVAVVGLGEAGYELHLPALAKLDQVTVVGAADPLLERRDRAAQEWSVPTFEASRNMLDSTAPDVVIVATPPDTHRALCLEALASGAHVIMEKPFVGSLAAADELIAAATSADRRIALNHEFREMPILRALRDAVDEEAGTLVFLQLWQLMDLPSSSEEGWRGELTHRTLFEAGVHLVDYALALFGQKPSWVQCATGTGGSGGQAADALVVATMMFPGGGLATITQSRVSKGARHYLEVRADTTRASYRASFGGRARLTAGLYHSTTPSFRWEYGVSGLTWREVGGDRTTLARNPKRPREEATRRVLSMTLEAFRTGKPAPADADWARDVIEVIVACYRSAETGRRVDLDAVSMAGLHDYRLGAPAGA